MAAILSYKLIDWIAKRFGFRHGMRKHAVCFFEFAIPGIEPARRRPAPDDPLRLAADALTMAEDWLDRWENGRTGWHESAGNVGLHAYWQGDGGRVLVPLCGKSPDLVWLAKRGHEVTGIELAERAIYEFYAEQSLGYRETERANMRAYVCDELPITLFCGDYFAFEADPFDALYDRGAIVAVEPGQRPEYAAHTQRLLKPGAPVLIITLEYDQSIVPGPPFALHAEELKRYWSNLERAGERDDFDTCPPKFRQAGLKEILEVVWRTSG